MRDDMKDLKRLVTVLIGALLLNAAIGLFVAYEAREANAHAAKAEGILNERTGHILRIERCACGE